MVADSDSKTALHIAALRRRPILVQSLLEHGACVDAICELHLTPLMMSVHPSAVHHNLKPADMQRTVKILIAANADLNAVDKNGRTALLLALFNFEIPENGVREDRAPSSVCIALIEAGTTQPVILFVKIMSHVTDGRHRPRDCGLQN